MSSEKLTESLQEAILAALAFDQRWGSIIAGQVTPENFDGVYHEVASAVLNYRKKYSKPPGKVHLEDLFARAKLDPSDRKTHSLRRVLVDLSAQSESINGEYLTTRVQDFVAEQRLKATLLQANERYMQGGDSVVSDVQSLFDSFARSKATNLDAGIFLSDYAKSSAFTSRETDFYSLGIPELDRYNIGLSPKRMLLYIAPKNSGKSWICVHAGRQALVQGAKVLYVSLEMPKEEVLDRIYQNFFGLGTTYESFARTYLEFDELSRFTGFKTRKSKPRLTFSDPDVKKFLKNKVKNWGARFGRLVIADFPSGTLTINQLRSYLDFLETVHKFIPNVLIIDYPDLFKLDTRDLRISLGRVFVDLRGLAGERNLALLTPTQSGRDSIGAKRVSSKNVTEDISKVFTADTVLTYSQTVEEHKLGLGRLIVEHARNAPKGSQILLSQAYGIGQYVTQSAAMNNAYWEKLEAATGKEHFVGDDEE